MVEKRKEKQKVNKLNSAKRMKIARREKWKVQKGARK